MSKAIIIKRDYIAYLKTLPPETIVGNRAQQESCPISREVERLHPGIIDVYTEYNSIAFTDAQGGHIRQCTPWIEDFIHAVDDRDCSSISVDLIGWIASKRLVTAAEALACLEVRA